MTDWVVLLLIFLTAAVIAYGWSLARKRSKPYTPTALASRSKNRSFEIIERMNFKQALMFANATQDFRSQQPTLTNGSSNVFIDFASISLNLLNQEQSKAIIYAKFPKQVWSSIESGRLTQLTGKDGRQFLIAVDSSGKFVSHAEQIATPALAKVAAASAIIVSAAHVISGYDNAKQLKLTNKKLDRVLDSMFNEQCAQLEAIYESVREHIHDTYNDSGKIFLFQLKHELKELRCNWIKNISSAVSGIELPSNSGISGWLNKNFSVRKNHISNKFEQDLSIHEQPFYLLKFALNLESVISSALSEEENFNRYTIPSVISQISELRNTIQSKSAHIQEVTKNPKSTSLLVIECDLFLALLGDVEKQDRKKAS